MPKKDSILCHFEIKADSLTEDNSFYYISGYGSVFNNVDYGNDVIRSGAFQQSLLKNKAVKMLWQHDTEMPIGVWTSLKEDSYGLLLEGKLPKEDTFVTGRVIPQLKSGSLDGLSIGFCVRDFEIDGSIRYIKQADLLEVSIVTFPMNSSAKIVSIKSVVPFQDLPLSKEDISWDSSSAIMRIREYTKSTDSPSNSYKKAFLWFDGNAPEDFTSYKLPIADVIDDELMAIPRAIFAAAAAINGARGGVNIPEKDLIGVKNNIESYYEKMGRDSPFTKAYNLDQVIDIKTKRDFEKLLRESGLFSKKASTYLASQFNEVGVKQQSDSVGQEVSRAALDLLNALRKK